ncbi:hypothetical protein GXW78_16855 [Roseomonas terrae]|uniref:Holin n=1 Tax=Neoroseomonas terrae TaxID=424799 RepID=A0ABS5EJY8_9PROT|nr:hypothetical protein [Neoroseomonas terrae]MBR0651345.1 hypothetical protein [Neoroseomonas terrae]
MNDLLGPDTAPIIKSLGAAFAGRALLILEARRDMPITTRSVLTLIIWEVPLIVAFALIGWHAASLLGFDSENGRVVLTALLANIGPRGIDRLVDRLLPPPPTGEKK